MSKIRRMMMGQSVKGDSSTAKIKMIYIVENSDYCTIGASGPTRQSLGITLSCANYLTANITIKNTKTNKIIYSGRDEQNSTDVVHVVCFEIYDFFPDTNPTQYMGSSYAIPVLDEDFILEERNYYEVNIEMILKPETEIAYFNGEYFYTIDPNDTSKNPTPYQYENRQLYRVISKTDNIDINDNIWHRDAIKE